MPKITATGTHYDKADVDHRLDLLDCGCGHCPQRAVFWLSPRDTVYDPITGGRVSGPGRVEITRYPSGSMHTYVGALA